MNIRNKALTGLMLSTVVFSCHNQVEKEESYNILFISVDDLRDWVGYLEGYKGKVYTPNIDRLASQGTAFTNAHAVATVCGPSRNSFFSGKRPSTTGLYNNNQWWKAVYPDLVMMPKYFKDNGYYSAGAGKIFHHTPGNNPPCSWDEYQEQVLDDTWKHAERSAEYFFLLSGYRGAIEPYPSWAPLNGIYPISQELDWGPIPGWSEQDYGDAEAVRFAKDFLTRDHARNFFLAIGIYRPHLPWHVPQKYFDMYPLDEIILPEMIEDDLNDIPEAGKVMASKGSGDFLQILAGGDLRFEKPRVFTRGGSPMLHPHRTLPAVTDWTGNGLPDLITHKHYFDGSVLLHRQTSNGAFEPPVKLLHFHSHLAGSSIVYWNGDGYQDILLGGDYGRLSGAFFDLPHTERGHYFILYGKSLNVSSSNESVIY